MKSSSLCGPGSSVGIANELRAGRLGDRIPLGARFSAPIHTGPGAHPPSCTMGNGSFPGVQSGRGVTLTTHSLLVPRSRKSTAIPLLRLWAVRPVQSLSACIRVHFDCFNIFFKGSFHCFFYVILFCQSTCDNHVKFTKNTPVVKPEVKRKTRLN